jgi:hypothetical protein
LEWRTRDAVWAGKRCGACGGRWGRGRPRGMCRASLRRCDRQGLRVKRRWFGVGGVGIGASGLGALWVRRGRRSG